MAEHLFRFIACTDKARPRTLARQPHTRLRLAQITDLHVPGELSLARHLRALMSARGGVSTRALELSAITNELGHRFRKQRQLYTNLIKKALLGLHALGVDHLLITGDLVHCGLSPEFLEIKAALSLTGWMRPERLTVIPGNHDRFNLYEAMPSAPMEDFFDVVSARHPRVKIIPPGLGIIEIDSNRDSADDRHYMERWLPNTVGRIYPETLDRLDAQRHALSGLRVLTLLHHQVSTDWYNNHPGRSWGGLMDPAEGTDDLIDLVRLIDPHSVILHGHIHDVMPLGTTYRGHLLSNPGGFAKALRLHLIDLDPHDALTLTQVELR